MPYRLIYAGLALIAIAAIAFGLVRRGDRGLPMVALAHASHDQRVDPRGAHRQHRLRHLHRVTGHRRFRMDISCGLSGVIALQLTLSTLLLLPADGWTMVLVLLILGLPVGPVRVTVFAIGGTVAPAGRLGSSAAPAQAATRSGSAGLRARP